MVASHTGLTSEAARLRLLEYGNNSLPEERATPIWRRFLNQFASPLMYLLVVAVIVDTAIWFREPEESLPFESIAIALILILNAGLGVYQEFRAESALQKLKALAGSHNWTIRDGALVRIPATELVPGDVVRLESGERVPADGRAIEAVSVTLDESLLTGESLPVDKLQDEEVFSGTLMVRGKAFVRIDRTGANSAMGRIAKLIGNIKPEKTPLEKRLDVFGRQVAYAVLSLAAAIAVAGVMVEGISHISRILIFAVALAVAAVPEGLPAVLTLTLALGVERMARRKAIVRKLSAVEALGSVTVIATDKTGTLTENRMQVKSLDAADRSLALLAMVLGSDPDARLGAGDPMELALLEYAQSQGLFPEEILSRYPVVELQPFDNQIRYMRVSVKENGDVTSYYKGAPEALAKLSMLSDTERKSWEAKAIALAREGYRVLGLARAVNHGCFELLGLISLWDPPRPEVPEAIRNAIAAGIRVVMITGDHPETAAAVARAIGIPADKAITGADLAGLGKAELQDAVASAGVFARVTPEDKLLIVEVLKELGEIVAMTGDGVNDAPALKRADVGIAMGLRGSDVSREVSSLVLQDDNFATIVAAIEEGRGIYENIRKFIRFLFSTNLAETSIIVFGVLGSIALGLKDPAGGMLLPLTAVQLLWVNIMTDGPPALALGMDRNPGVMQQKPRDPKAPLLDGLSLRFILITGGVKAAIGGCILIAMPQLGFNTQQTRDAIFLYATISQLVFAYPARRAGAKVLRNYWLHSAVILGSVLQLLAVGLPQLRLLLGLEPLPLKGFVLALCGVAATWTFAEFYSRIHHRLQA